MRDKDTEALDTHEEQVIVGVFLLCELQHILDGREKESVLQNQAEELLHLFLASLWAAGRSNQITQTHGLSIKSVDSCLLLCLSHQKKI